ncbi:zinc-dependent metalloprotease [Flavihumibacter rivuli]|uniref:M57 family metalloprotease n=1 Tax=Flavihumibacter rivuli TaxID=2838156 RepID=UPI001BDF107E|nr:M57 family metalloprotease [Flavihumibacter rivuli]ULQ55936.1 zinc-dependent metalloprotease [Flavihumibacter rivuli]
MQNKFRLSALALALLIAGASCKKAATVAEEPNAVTQEVVDGIKAMGFTTTGIQATDGGYIVEGDIFISRNDLGRNMQGAILRVGQSEQYRTTNLVTGLPRVITISVDSRLASSYVAATDEAIARFNAENLQLTFQRVSSGANIAITQAPRNAQYLASAGFPTAQGNPHNQVLVNTRAIGSQPQSTVATILAHEIGHCIGFRHTDYMDRSYSCGGSTANEGASTVGAILIPGTPAGPDPNSWMLACIGSGQNRPFNANDKTALSYLY